MNNFLTLTGEEDREDALDFINEMGKNPAHRSFTESFQHEGTYKSELEIFAWKSKLIQTALRRFNDEKNSCGLKMTN